MIVRAPFNAEQEARAFRIWQFANACGWDCTANEIGAALGIPPHVVGRDCAKHGWRHRLRKTEQYWSKRTVRAINHFADEFLTDYSDMCAAVDNFAREVGI